jgi:hypothetical protein
MTRQSQTDDARKMCDAELFEVECSTTVGAKQIAREQFDNDRVRCEVIEEHRSSCIVIVYDETQLY